MTTLTEFIQARLDSDEAYARNAFRPHGDEGPKNGPEWHEIWSGTVECGPGGEHIATFDSQLSRHIERHDPARVLREVAAKRFILELHPSVDGYCEGCGIGQQHPEGCLNLRALAEMYSNHKDFNLAWRTA